MRLLITGARSGIGRHIHENLGGVAFMRETADEVLHELKKEGTDVIIHCAFNSEKDISSKSLYRYFHDNIMLTDKIVSIPHKKFIFFSTVDIYPKNYEMHREDEVISADNVDGIYAVTKLISESIVKKRCSDYLIMRPTTLVGRYSRKNTLLRIIEEYNGDLHLSGNSMFNYVLHSDVLDFIKFSIKKDIQGTYNIASSDNIKLSEVASSLDRTVHFGHHLYSVGNISNSKVTSVFPALNKSSQSVLHQFTEEYARV